MNWLLGFTVLNIRSTARADGDRSRSRLNVAEQPEVGHWEHSEFYRAEPWRIRLVTLFFIRRGSFARTFVLYRYTSIVYGNTCHE